MTSPPHQDDYVSPTSLPGAIIDGKYRVDGIIGRGGVGLVVVATHLAMKQRVAIKMIRDDVPMQRELLDRFHREARAASMIRSEHVARVLDVGRLPTGRPYIVMEYLEGEDIEHAVARGPFPFTTAVDLSLQACEALAEAHRAGIIHRDLKPANLFLTRRADGAPLVKVLDFGISKIQPLTAARAPGGVETTSIMGSPGYMAPEQMKSTRDVDARADVWSLGAVLYEMVVGTPAFGGANMIEILNAIAACNPVPASHRQQGVPPAFDAVLGRCLTREPDHRFESVAELAVALQPFASPAAAGLAERAVRISQEPLPALDEPAFVALRSEPRPSSLTVVTPARRTLSRQRKVIVAAVAVGCLAGGAAGVLVLGASPPPPIPDSFVAAAVTPPASPSALASLPPLPTSAVVASATPVPSASVSPQVPAAQPRSPPVGPPPRPVVARPVARRPGAPSPTSPFGDRK
jgi:serine/threonine-protein kinase